MAATGADTKGTPPQVRKTEMLPSAKQIGPATIQTLRFVARLQSLIQQGLLARLTIVEKQPYDRPQEIEDEAAMRFFGREEGDADLSQG